MKLSYPVSTPDSQVKVQAFCGEYEAAFEWLAEHGYAGVEILVRDPAALSVERLDGLLARWGLNVSAIGTSPMQVQDHLFLLHPEEENRREAMARCRELIRLGEYYRAPVLIGKYRGQLADLPGCREADLDRVFREICGFASAGKVRVLMEPQNPDNINNLNTISQALAFIRRLGLDNLGIQADIYHMGITEESVEDSLKAAGDLVGFVHMADSGRMVPGLGELPIRRILQALEGMGYEGYISMEIRQWPDSRRASALSALTLKYLHDYQ